jgi:hypothetical protein
VAKQIGNLIKFTWSGTGTGEMFTTRGHGWFINVRRPMHDTTSEQGSATEVTPGIEQAGLRVRLFVDSADGTPTIPTGTSGTFTLYPNHAGSTSKNWTGTAYVESMGFQGTTLGGAPPQTVEYTLAVSGAVTRNSA